MFRNVKRCHHRPMRGGRINSFKFLTMKTIKFQYALLILILSIAGKLLGQNDYTWKFYTREVNITFLSKSPLEKIEANTNSGNSVVDMISGRVEVAVLIKSFNFEKALMQEHFNENYMESDKFPKAIFKGTILNYKDIHLHTEGNYTAKLKGDLTIHGVTKPMEIQAEFRVRDGKVFADSEFDLTVADYDISIPSLVRDNIAKIVKVKLKAEFQEFKKT
jgi:hypothetical protein